MATMIFVVVVFVVLLVAALAVAGRPVRHRLTERNLTRLMEALFYRGYDRGFLIVEAKGRPEFLQFAKYVNADGPPGLKSDFPRAAWSDRYYDQYERLVALSVYRWSRVPAGGDGTHEFIEVDFAQDYIGAARFADFILHELFHFQPQVDFRATLHDVSERSTDRIGFGRSTSA